MISLGLIIGDKFCKRWVSIVRGAGFFCMAKGEGDKKPGAKRASGGGKTMASSKGPSRSRSTGNRRKSGSGRKKAEGGSGFFRVLAGLFILVLIVVGAGYLIRQVFPPEGSRKKPLYEVFKEKPGSITVKKVPEVHSYRNEEDEPPEETSAETPEKGSVQEDTGKETPTRELPFVPGKRPDRTDLPRVALIIDDIGYDREMARKLAAIDRGITFSVLPHSPHRREIAAYARKKGMEIMLHLPMEPEGYPRVDPGPGALLMAQDPDALIETLKDNLESVPGVVGVNNHMGSRLTSESTKMYQVFTVLKKKNLFFVDSRTAHRSVCGPSASLLQIPYAERDVFLDHSRDREAIRRQVRTLVREAEKKGRAIGIGHPHEETYEILVEEYPVLSSRVRIVPVSKLVGSSG